jgi:HEAT repeat protein
MAGDYVDACRVAAALAESAANTKFIAHGACREALANLATSAGLHETVAILGELDQDGLASFADICRLVGPPAVDVLSMTLRIQERSAARVRASDIIVGFGAPAVARLAALIDDERAYVQCHAAEVLGRIAAPEAVPLLQPLLRRTDINVVRAAVTAISSINDPAAARAMHTVLRAVTGEQRKAVIDALVAERDARVVPMLVRILEESEPLGRDHAVVLDTLAALQLVHSNTAVLPIAKVAQRSRWFARSKNRALKSTAVDALASIGTAESKQALATAAEQGDRLLRKLARAKLAGS